MKRTAFTLMELLIVMAIIGILVAFVMVALSRAAEQAKVNRTRAIVTKIDSLIREKWEAYRVRAVPVVINMANIPKDSLGRPNGFTIAQIRLNGLRDLQRMEMPDRKTDVIDPPADLDPTTAQIRMAVPSVTQGYRRKATAGWTETSQGAECLFLILATMRDGDKNAIDYFSRSEIGDVDGDGMREILDAWGRPIEFIRWPAGYTKENNAVTMQTSNANEAPDEFDVLKIFGGYSLYPLVMSSGSDKEFDVFSDNTGAVPFHHYADPLSANNWPQPHGPFAENSYLAGFPVDRNGDGRVSADNITNHYQETP